MKTCPFCAEQIQDAATVCRYCGRDLPESPSASASASASQPSAQSQATSPLPDRTDDDEYPPVATAAAVILTLVMPVIALIVALVMRSSERGARKRESLKTWAIASGVWIATGGVIALIAFGSFSAGTGGCKGGIDTFAPAIEYTSPDDEHWTGTFPCRDGGQTTTPVPDPFPNK